MDIPYTAAPRTDTGVYNGKLGVWLFLASEVMLFGGLFSAYIFLRIGAPEWPGMIKGVMYETSFDVLSVPIGTFNTMVLIASSVTMVMAWASLMMKNFSRFRLYLGLTILLGLLFLIVKAFEYGDKFSHHFYPAESTFLAIYFTLTGLHGLHVVGGLIVNAYLWGPGSKMWKSDPQRFTNRVEIAGLYWHFVDIVWIFLFPTIYLL
ncbi:heme-copper oxidase subunit III [Candidatus Saccharibacteria bacterium]|nr:heme-copper oxidase subunit III [Candidatus Saccharibacteria bacterium]NIW80216.1 heme-copper oxidase subunit III [Calditrichia bacterium]